MSSCVKNSKKKRFFGRITSPVYAPVSGGVPRHSGIAKQVATLILSTPIPLPTPGKCVPKILKVSDFTFFLFFLCDRAYKRDILRGKSVLFA